MRDRSTVRVLGMLVTLAAGGCAFHGANPAPPAQGGSQPASTAYSRVKTPGIQHVIVIIQENRSFDNFFIGFPGADTVRSGLNHLGQSVKLKKVPINQNFDPGHGHSNFVTEADYDASSGHYKMDGFDLVDGCEGNPSCPKSVYTFVQRGDVANYWTLAKAFALGDETFQANMGPSFTAHQYLIAGQAGGYTSSHLSFFIDPVTTTSCFPPVKTVVTLDMTTPYPGTMGKRVPTCATYPTIFDELETAGIDWRYYARAPKGYWTASNTIQSLYQNDQAKTIVPQSLILDDIANHQLAPVSYVTPADSFSDHPFSNLTNHGQDWVGLITNAIGKDPFYWQNTVVIVTWDDWGGFYDHVPPPFAPNPAGGSPNPNEYGMRVPFIVVGAFVVPHTVDHTVRSFVSVLSFIETVFNLPSLGTLDAQSDNLMNLFNFSQKRNIYHPVNTHGFTGAQARWAALHSGPIDSDLP